MTRATPRMAIYPVARPTRTLAIRWYVDTGRWFTQGDRLRGQRVGIVIDPSTPFGSRVAAQLDELHVAWLTTTGRDQTPQPNPIWFIRDNDTVVILSEPDQPKLRNIQRTGRASFHFDESPGGGITIFTGAAEVLNLSAIAPDVHAAYAAKYQEPMRGINHTWETFGKTFNIAIRFTPEKLRGW